MSGSSDRRADPAACYLSLIAATGVAGGFEAGVT
jgi:hypothetical protein